MKEAENLFLKQKPVRALVIIYNSKDGLDCTAISRGIDSTYSHTVKTIQNLEDLDLVRTERRGRKKIVKVSETGMKQAKLYSDLLEIYTGSSTRTEGSLQDRDISRR